MNECTYQSLLDKDIGYLPALVVSSEQMAQFDPGLIRDPQHQHVIPFAGLIIPFHEVIFSTPTRVHEFLKSHFTRKLKEITYRNPLTVRACRIAGWAALEILSRKGLIVDQVVQLRVQRLVRNFPIALRHSTKPHILNKDWYFYTLMPDHRPILARELEVRKQAEAQKASETAFEAKPAAETRLWPNGF